MDSNTSDINSNRCPTCGSYIKVDWEVSLVMCNCGHGGRAWHEQSIGKCKYGNCPCKELRPIEAYIHPKGNPDKYKIISGKDFVEFYTKNKENLIFT